MNGMEVVDVLSPPVPSTSISFGDSLALRSDGEKLYVDAIGYAQPSPNAGALHVFSKSGDIWNASEIQQAHTPTKGQQFGCTLNLAEETSILTVSTLDDGVYLYAVDHLEAPLDVLSIPNATTFATAMDIQGNAGIVIGPREEHVI